MVEAADALKLYLLELLYNWPTVCTDKFGPQLVEEEIKKMLDLGVIRLSTSACAAPIVLLPKKGGETPLCIDFHALNEKTPLDSFPMPQVHENHCMGLCILPPWT